LHGFFLFSCATCPVLAGNLQKSVDQSAEIRKSICRNPQINLRKLAHRSAEIRTKIY
jgi:hypothetical protein